MKDLLKKQRTGRTLELAMSVFLATGCAPEAPLENESLEIEAALEQLELFGPMHADLFAAADTIQDRSDRPELSPDERRQLILDGIALAREVYEDGRMLVMQPNENGVYPGAENKLVDHAAYATSWRAEEKERIVLFYPYDAKTGVVYSTLVNVDPGLLLHEALHLVTEQGHTDEVNEERERANKATDPSERFNSKFPGLMSGDLMEASDLLWNSYFEDATLAYTFSKQKNVDELLPKEVEKASMYLFDTHDTKTLTPEQLTEAAEYSVKLQGDHSFVIRNYSEIGRQSYRAWNEKEYLRYMTDELKYRSFGPVEGMDINPEHVLSDGSVHLLSYLGVENGEMQKIVRDHWSEIREFYARAWDVRVEAYEEEYHIDARSIWAEQLREEAIRDRETTTISESKQQTLRASRR